jgi:hypothetical protein
MSIIEQPEFDEKGNRRVLLCPNCILPISTSRPCNCGFDLRDYKLVKTISKYIHLPNEERVFHDSISVELKKEDWEILSWVPVEYVMPYLKAEFRHLNFSSNHQYFFEMFRARAVITKDPIRIIIMTALVIPENFIGNVSVTYSHVKGHTKNNVKKLIKDCKLAGDTIIYAALDDLDKRVLSKALDVEGIEVKARRDFGIGKYQQGDIYLIYCPDSTYPLNYTLLGSKWEEMRWVWKTVEFHPIKP